MYTHTFEIELNGYLLEGEISFGDDVEIKYNVSPELSLAQMERINIFFRAINQLNFVGGRAVSRIEIVEK